MLREKCNGIAYKVTLLGPPHWIMLSMAVSVIHVVNYIHIGIYNIAVYNMTC